MATFKLTFNDNKMQHMLFSNIIKRKVSRGIALLCQARRLLEASTLITLLP